ncbi:protein big brother-like [Uloborus diversus]|uniref:protein big brother-like n=1 Tax=Uloborus diversus TaxID=327109 RepID=UPI00240964B2|nr:protein big brother-like [Uloborus diversus]
MHSEMLPLEKTSDYESVPRLLLKMPRVVVDQKAKFESDELFRKLSRESEVRYTGHRDRPLEERRMKFKAACKEGYTEIAFVNTGTNFQLLFGPCSSSCRDRCEFDTDKGKVFLKSSFIMNGVCVRWCGSLDLERLDGIGCLEFDEEFAQKEDVRLQQQIETYNKRIRDFESKHRAFRPPRFHRPRNEVPAIEEMSPRSSGSASN